jgi:hypothetical protein
VVHHCIAALWFPVGVVALGQEAGGGVLMQLL